MGPTRGDQRGAGWDPFGWALVAASAALLPVSAMLLHEYGAASDRHFAKQLPVTPSAAALTAAMGAMRPALAAAQLQLVHRAQPSPRSGVLKMYRVVSDGRAEAVLVVLRHDILCASCRDVLFAVLLDSRGDGIEGVLNLLPWEVDGRRVDAGPFLSQWAGSNVVDVLPLAEIDAITGATRTVHAVVDELAALANWGQQHAALFEE